MPQKATELTNAVITIVRLIHKSSQYIQISKSFYCIVAQTPQTHTKVHLKIELREELEYVVKNTKQNSLPSFYSMYIVVLLKHQTFLRMYKIVIFIKPPKTWNLWYISNDQNNSKQ